jgi:hypothetical protein
MRKNKYIEPNTKINRWTVKKRIAKLNKSNQAMYLCECECGTIKQVAGFRLRSGYTKSCGCLTRELSAKRLTTHGLTKHPLFSIWCSMMNRCYSKKNKAYCNYGARGIYVCNRWHDVSLFIKDNSSLAKKDLSIDRIDNNKGYFPSNTRFVTRKTQSLNRRSNINITYNGVTKPIFEWANDIDIKPKTLWNRIRKLNWSIEKAMLTPVKK